MSKANLYRMQYSGVGSAVGGGCLTVDGYIDLPANMFRTGITRETLHVIKCKIIYAHNSNTENNPDHLIEGLHDYGLLPIILDS